MSIATIAHEFSEVPFYLDRSDIPNLPLGGGEPLKEFLAQHREALLVVDRRSSIEKLRRQLPGGSRLQLVTERGPARLLRASIAPVPRIAETDDAKRIK